MMFKKALLVSTLTFSFLSAAPSEAALQAAEQLAETMGLKKQMETGFDAMLPIVEQQSAQLQLSESEAKEFLKAYKAWFLEDVDQEALLKQMVALYAEAFTPEELSQLSAFYKTPVGQKSLTALPELTSKGAQLGMQEAQKAQHLLLERLHPFLNKGQ